ncbi:MAG TPA: 2-oxoglutarate dehydrogenase E1 component [Verrucomicrobiales bacterium]|nr:2-oxoglutarate dehydrogenase E1 component [Verrucomicrobiales bacterium]
MSSHISPRFNAALLDKKYAQWCDDPQSVEANWAAFFEGFELGSTQPKKGGPAGVSVEDAPVDQPLSEEQLSFRGKVVSLIYNYRVLGHTQAHINPLHEVAERNPRLELEKFGIYESDLDREAMTRFFRRGEPLKLRDLVSELEMTYSGKTGFEFMHIHETEVRNWIRTRIEGRPATPILEAESKTKALRWLLESELFESFLGRKFLGEKRFSLEGGEGLMVLLNQILEECPGQGVKEIEMGMAHRGRLNVLAHFVKKSISTLLFEFTPNYVQDLVAGDGDVKYHLGYEKVRELPDGDVRVSLAANPSHLEAVNAVVEGKARARQRLIGDDGVKTDRKVVLPILVHGDAAFAGQGPVAEVLNLSQLEGYRTGGTIHLIVNNQIGFTTMPEDARSSAYATDVAKMIDAPILHVNGERPEELIWAAKFSMEYRQTWGRDVVIDMLCYRRQGHNENDQAAFTQPQIYRQLSGRKTAGQLYRDELVDAGVLTAADGQALHDEIWQNLEDGLEQMRRRESGEEDLTVFTGSTAEEQLPYSHEPIVTGIGLETLQHIGSTLTTIPEGFELHPTLAKRFVPRRTEALENGGPYDWAFAEALAFGSLLLEKFPVRLSGQDCRRGTFSHRHAVFYDYETRERFVPLRELSDEQERFCVYNSLLSEAAVLGFDYGYSLGCPNMLILWEAQFGDFANGAQVIIDQFISSAESKWQTPSSMVMLLPHGYEGMGPEHSSARLERFLQLCAEENMIVGNFTTPAQYFHALRRQKHSPTRKPLIVMTPKSLLTHPRAVSHVEDFLDDSRFQEILPDAYEFEHPERVSRVIFCSGKVYYDLLTYREEQQIKDAAIVRVEQLYPLNREGVKMAISPYSNAKKFIWCQEEPLNMGAWSFMQPRLAKLTKARVRYAGRERASSPSTGSKAVHKREQKKLVEKAFSV